MTGTLRGANRGHNKPGYKCYKKGKSSDNKGNSSETAKNTKAKSRNKA